MKKALKHKLLHVQGKEIALLSEGESDYICLTDMAAYKNKDNADKILHNWMRTRSTIDFLGLWEKLNNHDFKPLEFEGFKNEAGANSFVLSPQKWISRTGAIGLISKAGRYGGGTFAHKDIAFEFASWLSPEFKLYLIKEFQRLKEDENHRRGLDWDLKRALARINYRIHTDAVRDFLIPRVVTAGQARRIYANEADVLNVAIFGMTAGEWREKRGRRGEGGSEDGGGCGVERDDGGDGNLRDFATAEQLVVLSNLESINALLLEEGASQAERLKKLNKVAISQMSSLLGWGRIGLK